MTNEELVKEYQDGNLSVLDELCRANRGLIYTIVRDYRAVYAGECSNREAITTAEDIAQHGYIGLIDAAKAYDPERGASFSTAASVYIRRAIRRALHETARPIRIPEYRARQLQQLRKCRAYYSITYGRKPQIDEISAFCGIDDQQAEELLKVEMRANLASLDRPVQQEDGEATLADFVPDRRDTIEEAESRIYNDELSATLWNIVDNLGERPAAILRGCYEDGETLRQVCTNMGIAYGTGAGIRDKALRMLRSGRLRRVLRQFTEDYDRAECIAFSGSAGSFTRSHTSSTERAAFVLMQADSRAAKEAETLAKLDSAGISGKDRRKFRDIEHQKERKAHENHMQKLRNEF